MGCKRTVRTCRDKIWVWGIALWGLHGSPSGEPIRSCVTPLSAAEGKEITTIEGIKSADGTLHAVQEAWIKHQVPQCGYCQSGQIMSAVALLKETPNPTDEDIDTAMAGNVCRCGMYTRIKAAIKTAAKEA